MPNLVLAQELEKSLTAGLLNTISQIKVSFHHSYNIFY